MFSLSRGSALATCTLAGVAVVSAQDPAPAAPPQQGPNVTFRVEVNYVEVDARVLDAAGRFVRDLTRDDFDVVEDGVSQKVDTFALVDIPVERPERPLFASQPIEADVASNARDFDGRLYLIVLDDLHTAPHRTQHVRTVTRQFIEDKLGANDLAAVMTTRGSLRASLGFTGNRRLLLNAVDFFVGQKLPSKTISTLTLPEVVDAADPAVRFVGGSDPDQLQRALDAGSAMETLRNAANFMAGVHGRRKALLYLSEGIDYDIYDSFNNREASRIVAAAHEAVAAATRANMAIYSIDPRGLTTLGDDIVELTNQTDEAGPKSMLRELQTAHDGLRVLSAGTGGFAAVNASDLDGLFDRIVTENSSYYMLGYYPANARRDGRTRRITVRVRRPGLHVFARDNYIESNRRGPVATPLPTPWLATGAPVELLDVIRSPLPLTGLTMSATAAPFRGPDGKSSVAVVVEASGEDLGLTEDRGKYTGSLDVVVWAVDAQGKSADTERMTGNLSLEPSTFSRVREFGLRAVMRMDVPPGAYQVRVGARAGAGQSRGSVFYDLDVPDFSKEPLAMSGVVLTSASASRVLTAHPDPLLADVLPASPTTQREFPVGDELAIFAEIYDNDLAPHRVEITSRILTDDGQLVFTTSETRSNGELNGSTGGYGHTTRIPLAGFEPGLYVLRIEARNRETATEPVVREVQFRVRS